MNNDSFLLILTLLVLLFLAVSTVVYYFLAKNEKDRRVSIEKGIKKAEEIEYGWIRDVDIDNFKTLETMTLYRFTIKGVPYITTKSMYEAKLECSKRSNESVGLANVIEFTLEMGVLDSDAYKRVIAYRKTEGVRVDVTIHPYFKMVGSSRVTYVMINQFNQWREEYYTIHNVENLAYLWSEFASGTRVLSEVR